MDIAQLQQYVERAFATGAAAVNDSSAHNVFREFRSAIERGEIRSASPDASSLTGWKVNVWVK